MSGKSRGYAFDVDAWIQFHLLRLAAFHPETTKADVAVLAEIIQRYHGKFGNGWASHEHLGSMAGVHKASVIRAKRNLERLGFITVIQAGRRGSATVYRPNFDLVSEKGSKDATETKGSTLATETDEFGSTSATESTEYGSKDATPSYLQDRPTKAGSQIDRDDCAPALPPVAAGLEAAAPGRAQGFGELFKSYYATTKGHAGSKAKARAAYEKMDVTPEIHADLVASARAWHDAWAAQGNPDAPRMHLSTWLEREEFENNPPSAFQPKERKAKATKPKAEPANANGKTMRVISFDQDGSPFDDFSYRVTLDDDRGNVAEYVMHACKDGQPTEEAEVCRMLEQAGGKFPGARIIVEAKGDRIISISAAPQISRIVKISEADTPDRVNVTATLTDLQGRPEGRLDLDATRLAALCEVLGIVDIKDTDELLNRAFTVDELGDFLPMPSEQEAA